MRSRLSLSGSLGRELGPGQGEPARQPPHSSPTAKFNALQERFRQLRNDRKVRRGILFPEEIEEIRQQDRARATAYFTARLSGGRPEHPLSRRRKQRWALATTALSDAAFCRNVVRLRKGSRAFPICAHLRGRRKSPMLPAQPCGCPVPLAE